MARPALPPCSVLIASAELMQSLRARAGDLEGELLTFTDTDALHAAGVIIKRRPKIVILERTFAVTPRGAALIDRIKDDPALSESEVRVVAHDGNTLYTSQSRTSAVSGSIAADMIAAPDVPAAAPLAVPQAAPRIAQDAAVPPTAPAVLPTAPPTAPPAMLDARGTRRAPRFAMAGVVEALIDGSTVSLIDLSKVGAQVVSTAILKPNQRVRLVLTDAQGIVRLNATVAWASFEIPAKSGACYRAGLEFVAADPAAVDAYCARHTE